MSEEIIKVLNYIGEKLGIAIDWTAENALPQVMDILGRYRLFELVSMSMWIIIEMCVIIATVVVFGKSIKSLLKFKDTNEDNFWWYDCCGVEPTGTGLAIMIIFGIIGLACMICFFVDMSEILKWLFVPEIKYLELLKGYMQ